MSREEALVRAVTGTEATSNRVMVARVTPPGMSSTTGRWRDCPVHGVLKAAATAQSWSVSSSSRRARSAAVSAS